MQQKQYDEFGDELPYTIELTPEQVAKLEAERQQILEENRQAMLAQRSMLGKRNIAVEVKK